MSNSSTPSYLPQWTVASYQLPPVENGYSFNANIVELTWQFVTLGIGGEIIAPEQTALSVVLLNGNLPPNIGWQWNDPAQNIITLFGEINDPASLTEDQVYSFTFRITSSSGNIADQTFEITILAPSSGQYGSSSSSTEDLTWITQQNTSLGYFYPTNEQVFTIVARSASNYNIAYSISPDSTTSSLISIDSQTGALSFNFSWSFVNSNTTIPIFISATTNFNNTTTTITGNFSITLVSLPSLPIWITPAGSIGSVLSGEWFTFNFQTVDPQFNLNTFSSNDLPSWLTLTELGELYGKSLIYNQDQYITFHITATSTLGSTSQEFNLVILKQSSVLSWSNSLSFLGTVNDNTFSSFVISASSNIPGDYISYSFTGGSLPPLLNLDSETGSITGLVDYHTKDHTYYFEITAQGFLSGQDKKISQQFSITVKAQLLEEYTSVTIPITGSDKINLISVSSGSLVSPQYFFSPNNQGWGRTINPEVNIVSGLKTANPVDVANVLSSLLTKFKIIMEEVYITTTENSLLPYRALFLTVRDANSLPLWKPFQAYSGNTRLSTGNGGQFVSVLPGGTSDGWESSPDITLFSGKTPNSVIWVKEQGQNSLGLFPDSQTSTGLYKSNLSTIHLIRTLLINSVGFINAGEVLPAWQREFIGVYSTLVYLGAVKLDFNSQLLENTQSLSGVPIQVDQLKITVQGITPAGDTLFDGFISQFDAGFTVFEEVDSAAKTMIDGGELTMDNGKTTLDSIVSLFGDFSSNVNSTMNDFYAFSQSTQRSNPTSQYSASWLIPMADIG